MAVMPSDGPMRPVVFETVVAADDVPRPAMADPVRTTAEARAT